MTWNEIQNVVRKRKRSHSIFLFETIFTLGLIQFQHYNFSVANQIFFFSSDKIKEIDLLKVYPLLSENLLNPA